MQEQVIAAALFEGPVNDAIVRLVGTYVLDQLNTERAKVEALEMRLSALERKPARTPDLKYMVRDKHGHVICYTYAMATAEMISTSFRDATVVPVAP
jgi:hypothetical protein